MRQKLNSLIQGRQYQKQYKFWVYYTSDCSVEEFDIRQNKTINLVNLVKKNHFYGGYCLKYNLVGIPYDGSSLRHKKDGELQRFFDSNNYGVENGENLTPIAGKTYYLKEVPNSYKKYYKFYAKSQSKITWYLIVVIDDSNYKQININNETAKIAQSITIREEGTTRDHKITPKTLGVSRGYLGFINVETEDIPSINETIITMDNVEIKFQFK